MNPKVVWAIVGVVVVILLGYLASRVGNIGARSIRSGDALALEVSDPIVPGVPVAVHWNTSLGEATAPIILKARGQGSEVPVGKGEFGAGQGTITLPCEMGGGEVGIGLYQVSDIEKEELLGQITAEVLSPGPDCLR